MMSPKSTLIISLWLTFSARRLAAAQEEGGQRQLPICPKSQVKVSPKQSGHEPWTHAPHCIDTGTGDNKLCVYTDANFHHGDGLSIVARPEVADKIVSKGLLKGSANDISRTERRRKYDQVETPGSGIGLFVRSGEKISAGEVFMVDYPTMIVPSGSVDSMDPNDLAKLRWMALLQLSDETRARTRSLAQSRGAHFDEIVNIFDTNAFTHKKGDALHDIIFPEASVSDLAIFHTGTTDTLPENEPQLSTKVQYITPDTPDHFLVCFLTQPSALTRTNQTTLAMEVVALRDIHAGEEIFNSYLDPMSPSTSEQRKKDLVGWSFSCNCPICSGDKVRESDQRRRKIVELQEQLESARGDASIILKYSKQLLALMEEEGMILPKGDYYELAARGSQFTGRKKEALQYAVKAKKHWEMLFGIDSKEARAMDEFMKELK